MISSYLSNCPSSLSRSTINCHPHSVSLSTSHFPLEDPPQGPLSRLFAHRAIGQIPPVLSRMHVPHPWHRSLHTPCSSVTPKKLVLTTGRTDFVRYFSATYWTPAPQAIDRITS